MIVACEQKEVDSAFGQSDEFYALRSDSQVYHLYDLVTIRYGKNSITGIIVSISANTVTIRFGLYNETISFKMINQICRNG